MIYKAGDKVWCECNQDDTPKGWQPGIVIGLTGCLCGCYDVTVYGITRSASEKGLRPRDDPPAKREDLGEWDLCPWQPKHVTVSGEHGN